jgi:hypothetical protein
VIAREAISTATASCARPPTLAGTASTSTTRERWSPSRAFARERLTERSRVRAIRRARPP